MSTLLEYLRASLWFVPLIGLLLALSLAVGTVWLDTATDLGLLSVLITDDADTARGILSVVATSMLSFTALVFTITILVLQLAASQYSPRITRAFLRDRQTKLTLALFLGTFAYSLLVLRSVRSLDEDFVPTLSVGVTYLLVFASLLAFTWYLDHVSQSIRVSNIVRMLAREGAETYDRCARVEDETEHDFVLSDLPVTRVIDWRGEAGVLSYIDEQGLARLAARAGAVIVVRHAIGDFVTNGASLIELRGADIDADDAAICERIAIGPDRTPQQDLGLPIRHLVDVALRALSPGVNDPTTAVQALDYIHDLLRRLAPSPLPPRNVPGPDGQVRLVLPRASWPMLVTLAVSEIRLVAADQLQVSRRVLYMLDDLLFMAPAERRPALEHQRYLWLRATRAHLPDDEDRRTAHRADPQGLGATHP